MKITVWVQCFKKINREENKREETRGPAPSKTHRNKLAKVLLRMHLVTNANMISVWADVPMMSN